MVSVQADVGYQQEALVIVKCLEKVRWNNGQIFSSTGLGSGYLHGWLFLSGI
jgi:hypothetical protein